MGGPESHPEAVRALGRSSFTPPRRSNLKNSLAGEGLSPKRALPPEIVMAWEQITLDVYYCVMMSSITPEMVSLGVASTQELCHPRNDITPRTGSLRNNVTQGQCHSRARTSPQEQCHPRDKITLEHDYSTASRA